MKNIDIAISQSNNDSDQLQFELEKKSDAKSYGLNLWNNVRDSNGSVVSKQDVDAMAFEPAEKGMLKDFKHYLKR